MGRACQSFCPILSDSVAFLSQEAAEINTRRLALQKRPTVAQVIKDLEEQRPVHVGYAPWQQFTQQCVWGSYLQLPSQFQSSIERASSRL